MHTTTVTTKNGDIYRGRLWTVRSDEGWFTLWIEDDGEEDEVRFSMLQCKSVVTRGERVSENVIEDHDKLPEWLRAYEDAQAVLVSPLDGYTNDANGVDRHGNEKTLGGSASVGGTAAHYLFCSRCSPEPLDYVTAVVMQVRTCGWEMKKDGHTVGVDVIECPACHAQILR